MHSNFTSLAILLLGQATLATWPAEIKGALQEVAGNPIKAGGEDSDWMAAGNNLEFYVTPVPIKGPNLDTAKTACKELDSSSSLFYTDVSPQGTNILVDFIH